MRFQGRKMSPAVGPQASFVVPAPVSIEDCTVHYNLDKFFVCPQVERVERVERVEKVVLVSALRSFRFPVATGGPLAAYTPRPFRHPYHPNSP